MQNVHPNKRAIVIGASMGGLLAARALADYYGEVTVIERDALPDVYEPQKGRSSRTTCARPACPGTRGA